MFFLQASLPSLVNVSIRLRIEGIFFRGAIMLLPDRNHLSQVSTTCSSCIYHIGFPLNASAWQAAFCQSMFVDHVPLSGRRHIRTRVRARKQIWMANYGDNDAELDGDRKETETLFDDTRARDSLPHRQLRRADLSRPDDRSLRVIINENLLN